MNLLKKNAIFRWMVASNVVSKIGDSIYYIALMSYANSLADSTTAIMWVSISETLPGIFDIVFGVISDQTYNRVKHIQKSYLYRAIIYICVGFVIGLTPSLQIIIIVSLLNFISDMFGYYAARLYVPFSVKIVEDKELEESSGIMSAIQRVSTIFAQFIGSLLIITWLSYQQVAWINSLAFLLGGLMFSKVAKRLSKIEVEELKHNNVKTSIFKGLKTTLVDIYSNKVVFALVVQITFVNMILFPLSALFGMVCATSEAMIIDNYGFTLALFSALGSVGVILGNLLIGNWLRNLSFKRILMLTYISVLLFAIALIMKHAVITLIMYTVACLSVGMCSPKYGAIIVRNTDNNKISSILGAVGSISCMSGPIINMLVTSVAATISIVSGITVLIVFVVIGTLFLLIYGKQLIA